MKKLLFITHQLSRTGAPIVLLDMLRICRDAGYEITVISLLDGELKDELSEMEIPVSVKDDFFHDRENFRPYAETFDAVVCNTLLTYQVIHVLDGSETPVLWWLHEGEQYFEYFKTVLPDFAALSENIHIFSVGHYVQDVVRRRFGVDTEILHFGVTDCSNASTDEDALSDTADIVRFVIAGTYSNVKAQDVLCDAIRILPDDTMRSAEFIFCGNETTVDDAVYGAVCRLCDDFLSVAKRGALPHEETLSLMRRADFLIAPSRVDPIPTVAAEAMMLQKPCVITDVCGIAHYLSDGDNAFVCPADNADLLAKKIEAAVVLRTEHADAYETMCKKARTVYDEYFSFAVFKPKVRSIFSELTTPTPAAKEKLIFAVGVYDILDIFTYAMLPEFKRRGYETFLFDTNDMVQSLGKLYDFIKTPVKACVTFNNLAFNTELTPGQNLWEALQIPVINILMDHPFCHKTALDAAPRNAIVLCPDKNHMRYLQRFYPEIKTVGFLPHGGKMLSREIKPLAERSIDILYAGGISRKFAYKMMPDFSKYDFDAKKVADEAYEMMLENPSLTTEDALETRLIANGVSLSEKDLCAVIADLHYIDLLIVSHFREQVVRTIAEAGLRVTLFGSGWDVCDWINDCPTLDFRGRVSADEIVELMHDTKLVLSTMTWFKDGTHDRVFNGMLAGAMTATDASVYMKEEFNGDETSENAELLMFELTEIDTLPQRLQALFHHPAQMQKIADRGMEKALSFHTWKNRADELHEDLLAYL